MWIINNFHSGCAGPRVTIKHLEQNQPIYHNCNQVFGITMTHQSVYVIISGHFVYYQQYKAMLTLNGETSLSHLSAVTLLPLGQFSPKMFVLQTPLSHQIDQDNCAYKTNIFLLLHLQWFCSYFQKCHKKSLKSLPIRVYQRTRGRQAENLD